MRTAFRLTVVLSLAVLGVAPVLAQEPAPPQTPAPAEEPAAEIPLFTGSFGAGLSMTRGNADTTMFNVSFGATYDPGTFGVVKAEGLYLRGTTDGEDTADRMFFLARYERALTSLIEPLLIMVMGVVVGGILICLYLPMFNIGSLIQ